MIQFHSFWYITVVFHSFLKSKSGYGGCKVCSSVRLTCGRLDVARPESLEEQKGAVSPASGMDFTKQQR